MDQFCKTNPIPKAGRGPGGSRQGESRQTNPIPGDRLLVTSSANTKSCEYLEAKRGAEKQSQFRLIRFKRTSTLAGTVPSLFHPSSRSPGGTADPSPPFQRWVRSSATTGSPSGAKEGPDWVQDLLSSPRDSLGLRAAVPTVETVGYGLSPCGLGWRRAGPQNGEPPRPIPEEL